VDPTAWRRSTSILACVDAAPWLAEIAQALQAVSLEAVLIGNAGAALQGAPVTTVDFDFFFRKTTVNLGKLKRLAAHLDATVLRPYYPVSNLYRVVRERDGLQIDFMPTIHGARSFEGVRDRASDVAVGAVSVRVASLDDIIRSKKAAKRPRDLAVIELLEKARDQARSKKAAARRPEERK
jgi:predicted nucleotidyltransferase